MADFSFTYRAFISYAHADHAWGVWLHRTLERYRVPRRLAGAEGLRRLGRMFRDEEELAAASELGPKIDAALKASDVLIVVCSPRSAKSKWVNQEIEAFKRLGREHRVFALIVDGEPHDAEWECFPDGLKWTVARGPAEPLAVDVRKFGREDAALRLIAGILDIGYDDLRQREVRRRRAELRRAQVLFASALALVAAALTGGYFAASNYVTASEKTSRLFAREADELFAEGYHAKAMLMALYGDPAAQGGWAEQMLRPEGFGNARQALVRAYTHNRLVTTFAGHTREGFGSTQEIKAAAFSADGKSIVSISNDDVVKNWSTTGGTTLSTSRISEVAQRTVLALSSDGRELLTGSTDGIVAFWPALGGDALATFHGPAEAVRSLAMSRDGTLVAAGFEDGVINVWPTAGGDAIANFKASDGKVSSVTFSPDGRTILTAGDGDAAKLWSISGGNLLSVFGDHKNGVTALAFSPNGSNILTGEGGDAARLWSGSGRRLAVFEDNDPWVNSVSFSADGKQVLVGSNDWTAKLWDESGGLPIATFHGHDRGVAIAALSLDGEFVLTGYDDGLMKVWRARGKQPISLAAYKHREELTAYSPDRNLVVKVEQTGDSGDVARLFPAAGGAPLAVFSGHTRWIFSVAFSPDGQTVMTGAGDGTAKLWSVSGGPARATLCCNPDFVSSVAFSPDGQTVLTGGGDGEVKLWPASGGEAIETFKGRDQVESVAYAADGKSVLIGLQDGTAEQWIIDPIIFGDKNEQVRSACNVLKEVGVTEFSEDDYQQFPILDRGAANPCTKMWAASDGKRSP